jgi:hypothetical protein
MKNPRTPMARRGGSSVSTNQCKTNRIVSETANSAQAQLPIEIAKFWRNRQRKESVVLRLREFEGVPLVDLRVFETGPDGIDRPTSKGIALSIKRLPALADAFAAANREARRLGLFGATGVSS